MTRPTTLISGNASPSLARSIADCIGVELADVTISAFRDGEIQVRVHSDLRGHDVFVVQSMSMPVNQHLVELLLLIDAVRRGAASRITAVVPYFAYGRQERMASPGQPISARLMADLIQVAGADRMVTIDLHAPAIEGFFKIPVEHLRAGPTLAAEFGARYGKDLVVAAPDEGAVERAVQFREALGLAGELAVLIKQRPKPDQSEVVGLVGQVAISDRPVVLVDDIISTGGTLIQSAGYLMDRGARAVIATAVHPVLADDAAQRLTESPLDRIVVTNSLPIPEDRRFNKLEVVDVAPLLCDAILRIGREGVQ